MNKNSNDCFSETKRTVLAGSLPPSQSFSAIVDKCLSPRPKKFFSVPKRVFNTNPKGWDLDDEKSVSNFALSLLEESLWSREMIAWVIKSAPFIVVRDIIKSAAKNPSNEAGLALEFLTKNSDPRDINRIFCDLDDELFKTLFQKFQLKSQLSPELVLTYHAEQGNIHKLSFLVKDLDFGSLEDIKTALCNRKTPHSDIVNEILLTEFGRKLQNIQQKNLEKNFVIAREIISFCIEKLQGKPLGFFVSPLDHRLKIAVLKDYVQSEKSKNVLKVAEISKGFLSDIEMSDLCSSCVEVGNYQSAHLLAGFVSSSSLVDRALLGGFLARLSPDYPLFSASLSRQLIKNEINCKKDDDSGGEGKRKL